MGGGSQHDFVYASNAICAPEAALSAWCLGCWFDLLGPAATEEHNGSNHKQQQRAALRSLSLLLRAS